MAITRFKNSSIANKGPKYDNALAGLPYIPIIGTATDGGNGTSASVAFTGNNVAGAGITYTALSTPGSFTGTGTASPVTVTGLTAGTSYTFQVKAGNSLGDSAYSAASNSVTPVTPTAFDSIATSSLSGVTTVTFSNIPSDYQHLQLRFIIRDGVGYGSSIRFNSDTGNNYARHALGAYLSGGSMTVFASGTATTNQIGVGNWNGQTTSTFSVGIIDIHDYKSTTKNKTVRAYSGVDSNGAAEGSIDLLSGLWMNTSAITSITFFSQGATNFTANSSVALYGIKG